MSDETDRDVELLEAFAPKVDALVTALINGCRAMVDNATPVETDEILRHRMLALDGLIIHLSRESTAVKTAIEYLKLGGAKVGDTGADTDDA